VQWWIPAGTHRRLGQFELNRAERLTEGGRCKAAVPYSLVRETLDVDCRHDRRGLKAKPLTLTKQNAVLGNQ
jgi:hypothetical protein